MQTAFACGLRRLNPGGAHLIAIYHLSVKTISRSAGRSATAAAAYRAGVKITDERTGEIHDYTRKGGVESAELVLPAGAPEWAADRAALWNAAEQAETRKNSTVAREFEIALPEELSPAERARLARDFARELVERHGCAADVCIHAPGKDGDDRNHHAHILLTTRRLGPEGLTEKTRELDDQKTGAQIVTQWRERFAQMQNSALERAGCAERVDHRTLKAQGIEREATRHLGPGATGYERRTGDASRRRLDQERAAEVLQAAREAGELERQERQAERSILDLSGDLEAAIRERDQEQARQAAEAARQAAEQRAALEAQAKDGMAEFMAQFELRRQAEDGMAEFMAQFQERQRQEAEAERRRQEQEAARKAEAERRRQERRRAAERDDDFER